MNSPALSKILYALVGLLTLTTAALFWQHRALSGEFAANRQLCEQRVAEMFANFEAGDANNKSVSAATVAYTPATTPVQTKPAKVQETAATQNDDKPKLQRFDESLEEIVKRKYRFLLARLNLSAAEMDELIQLLIEREHIALQIRDAERYGDEVGLDQTDIADLKYELEDIDERIQLILANSEENSERYALLKDSDSEQHEFSQYTLGITGLFPLSGNQQETVLLARLKHKQKFESEIAATGYNMDYPLTPTQQGEIIAKLEKAAYRYKEAYLRDVRPHLEHENFPMDQYTLLENYTKTEFETLVASLREQVENRGLIGE